MGRRVVQMAGPSASQLDGDARDIPPSTISALVQHQSRAKTSGLQDGNNQLVISELLQDIRANPHEHLGDDLDLHCHLIHALIQGLSGVVINQNPFQEESDASDHVLSCLEVIDMTITRTPKALFHDLDLGSGNHSILVMWMLPKLMAATNTALNDQVSSRMQRMLELCLAVFNNSYRSRDHLHRLQLFYRICVQDLVASIKSSGERQGVREPHGFSIPSIEARTAISGSSSHTGIVLIKHDSQICLKSIQARATVALRLLLALLRSCKMDPKRPSTSSSTLTQTWYVEMLRGIWSASKSVGDNASEQQKSTEIPLEMYHCLDSLITGLPSTNGGSASLDRFTNLIKDILVDRFLDMAASDQSQLPDAISKLLLTLSASGLHSELPATSTLQLEEAIRKVLNAPTNLDAVSLRTLNEFLKILPNFSGDDLIITLDHVDEAPSSNGTRLSGDYAHSNGNAHSDAPPSKRRKVDQATRGAITATSIPLADDLIGALCALLGDWNRNDLSGLRKATPGLFSDLSSVQQQTVLTILIKLPGAGGKAWKDAEWNNLYGIICNLLEAKDVSRSKVFRGMMSNVVKAFTLRTTQSAHLDLTKSVMGKWCLQNLRSSIRQLRVPAALTLANFMGGNCSREVCRRNRMIVLDVLRQLTVLHDHRLAEALVVAFGQVAIVCEEDERAIALNQLVGFLGHASKLVCDMALLELNQVTHALHYKSPIELFDPYWRVIGVTVVKDILVRPRMVQQLAELIGHRVDQLLLHIQTDVLPWLILEKRQDILARIAKARSPDTSVFNLCIGRRRNISAILSAIIVQHPDEIEDAITACITHAGFNEHGDGTSALDLIRGDIIGVACETLKLAGDKTGIHREKAAHGFHELTVYIEKKGQQARAASTQARMSTLFFENHALGIMNSLSTVIDNDQESVTNKRRCLAAIEQLIAAGQSNIKVALPQIRACLQSALKFAELKDSAFTAWSALVSALSQDEELDGLIEQTFAAIVQHWDTFSHEVQQLGYELVTSLVKQHSDLIQHLIASIPSLKSIAMLSKTEGELSRFRDKLDVDVRLQAFTQRCEDEGAIVVLQAVRELCAYLEANQHWIHQSVAAEHPSSTVSELMRALLDSCVKYTDYSDEILELSAKCIGIIGCLDPNMIETIRDRQDMVVLSNFDEQPEAVDFVTYLMEEVLVRAFHSVSNPRAQGFLGYVMQELLRFCGFDKEAASPFRPQGSQRDEGFQRWIQMSERTRSTLTPFLSSHYVLTTQSAKGGDSRTYPIFPNTTSHGSWLRTFVLDLLQRPKGDNATQVFGVLSRVIRGYDVSIAGFILPFAFANVVLGGTEKEAEDLGAELLAVLQHDTSTCSQAETDATKVSSQNVFDVLDYLSRFVQAKRKALNSARAMAARTARPMPELEEQTFLSQIASIERILSRIPAHVISRRAVECGSYARALFHWEQHMRNLKRQASRPQSDPVDEDMLYQQLQDIYSEIDEPDGVEGISAYLHVLKPEQQVLEHQRAGRWAAAQSWYELRLMEEPEDVGLHIKLLDCLKHAGQHRLLLDHALTLTDTQRMNTQVMSIVSEAAWNVENFDALSSLAARTNGQLNLDFNVGLGSAMAALQDNERMVFSDTIRAIRIDVAKTMSRSATASLQTCHDQLLKLHALHEVETLSGLPNMVPSREVSIQKMLDQRLNILGSYIPDKQYLLAIRRAVMTVSELDLIEGEVASAWLTSARLARKEKWSNIAYEAVLNAADLGDETTKFEQAKLLWSDGEHNKAIKSLENAIAMNAFNTGTSAAAASTGTSFSTAAVATTGTAAANKDAKQPEQNPVLAKAHLLLARWLDGAGQTQSMVINQRYQQAARVFTRWEKGLYFLGRFYNKLLESEKALPPSKQNHTYLSGETAKLVVENFLRSLMFGCKYLFESVPKLLTLWLDFGIEIGRPISKEVADDVRQRATASREDMLDKMNKQIRKYLDKLPAYLFYPSLAQMITRMGHQNKKVYELLALTILKVVSAHPQQGLWPLLAVVKSTAQDRVVRANSLIGELMKKSKSVRNEGQSFDLRSLVNQGQKMSNALLHASEVNIGGRSSIISLSKDMGFSAKVAPCPLVVPVDQHLAASLPMTTKSHAVVKGHRAFPSSKDAVTISSFQDDVLILNSLQRPRKLTVRGSDGLKYGLLCKPNDDLRKDQRLMEFNAMINRGLKKDAESSKRRLYIRTYAVTPLNEACGLIEWVEGLKPMRDILLNSYRSRGTKVDYNLLRELLNEACSRPGAELIFSEQIVPMYEPVLHEWFTEHFADPEAWLAARLRYARSAAVTSMQGYVLGLGDRHGENVLLEESNGGVFHVDFNCLFEKGLTFDKPELVPFRLTHNMVDACGAYGVEGPFRRSAECAMKVMRANEDALLTILETFVYDPTADFVGARKRPIKGVPETPKEVLESVRGKLRGLLRGESVPLSVAGHVDALIRQATDPKNLCAMYIGWCAFL